MPQCGRLRAISVCGLEPADPPPQKIAEEMKDPPANPARRHHASYRARSRLDRGPGDGPRRDRNSIVSSAHPPIGCAAGGNDHEGERKQRFWTYSYPQDQGGGLECDSGMIKAADLKLGDFPSSPWRTNPSWRETRGRLIWSMFQASRQRLFQNADCFSWRERGKLCGVARRNKEQRRGRPRDRPFRGR